MKGPAHALGAVIYFLIGISAEKGAQTTLHVATSPALAEVSGKYFVDCKEVRSSASSYDAAVRRRLWEVSEELVSP